MGKTVQKVRMGLVAVGLTLMFVNAGHSLGVRQDAGLALAIEVLVERRTASAAAMFVMGGTVYHYTEQDWRSHQGSLVDALTETYISMTYAPKGEDKQHLSAGYSLLLARASQQTYQAHSSHLRLLGLRSLSA